jgi:hypothetical protein
LVSVALLQTERPNTWKGSLLPANPRLDLFPGEDIIGVGIQVCQPPIKFLFLLLAERGVLLRLHFSVTSANQGGKKTNHGVPSSRRLWNLARTQSTTHSHDVGWRQET